MRWRRTLPGGFPKRNVASAALLLATRSAHPPRRPAWASTSLCRSSRTVLQGEVPSPTVAASTSPSAGQSCGLGSPSRITSGQISAAAYSASDLFTCTPSSGATSSSSSSLVFSSGVNNGGVGSAAMTPLPQSYAYVNSAAAANTTVANSSTRRRSRPPRFSRAAVSPAAPASPVMKVAMDGEDKLVAAAPGTVRRALRQQGNITDGDKDGSDPEVGLHCSVAHPLAAAFRNSSQEGGDVPGRTAPSTLAERRAQRLRQRRTREAQERRRQERAQEQSGTTLHPCRLQGGCQHQVSGSTARASFADRRAVQAITHASICPYRHYPSHYCVTQLRDGYCFLHDVGCCPWTHGDLGEGVGRASPGSVPSSEDASFDFGMQGLAPLVPLESPQAEAALRRSAKKVGELLQLFLDVVNVMMEGATTEQQARFVRSDVSAVDGCGDEVQSPLKCWWESLAAVARGSPPPTEVSGAPTLDTVTGGRREGEWVGLRLEVLPSEGLASDTRAWRMLSMPAEVVWCALSPHSEDEVPLSFSRGEPSNMCASPFTKEECEYWSSYFTVTAPSHLDAVHQAAAGVCRNSNGAPHDGVSDPPRVRLTPCATAWVLKAAATLMRAKNSQRAAADAQVDGVVYAAGPATTASACFEEATLILLGWRRAELQRCLSGEMHQAKSNGGVEDFAAGEVSKTTAKTSIGRRPHERSLSAESPLGWSAVLFLRDALCCTHLYVEQLAQAALEQNMILENQIVDKALADGESYNDKRRTTLFDVFVDALRTSGATDTSRRVASATLVRDGAFFSSGDSYSSDLFFFPPTHSPSTAAEGSSSASVRAFHQAWDEAHALAVQLQQGLLQCHGGKAFTTPAANVPLCLHAQPAMLHVVSSLSVGFARHYETDLRRTAGWRSWTDAQLFAKEHSAVYNADTYSRHHMPVVRLGLHNSLLNTLLLLTTHHANTIFRLQESSDVGRVLLASPLVDLATPKFATVAPPTAAERQASLWQRMVQQEAAAYQHQHLKSSVALSMGVLTALQEHSREQLEIRDGLMREYEQRRAAYERDHEKRQSPHSQPPGDGRGASRVRKYHGLSQQFIKDSIVEQQQRLEELHGVSLLDRLLPFGSATVSPDATASLLRQLLEGGHPYKALKLAASIVHASRMLRHADKQPRPSLEQGFRTVHTRVWSRRLQRHVLVKKQVPVLRLVGDFTADRSNDHSTRPGAQARRSVLPIGLAFVMNDRVVVEMARVGLRMGEAGAALVSGVVQDCQRGALLDFTQRRGLPAPVWEDVVEMLFQAKPVQPLSSVVAPASVSVPARTSSQQLHKRKGQGGRCRNAERSVADLLAIMGVGGDEGLLYRNEGEVWGAVHQRITPTPALLEVLESHTPPSDAVQHTVYLKLLLQDVTRFSTVPVLLALQYQACFYRSRFATWRADGLSSAAAAMQTAYVMTLSALGTGLYLKSDRTASGTASAAAAADSDGARRIYPSVLECSRLLQALRAEAEARLPAVQESILADASSLRGRQGAQDDVLSLSSAASRVSPNMDEVKALLLGTSHGSSVSSAGQDRQYEGQEATAGSALRRRAKLSLAVLLHHLWTSSILARSAAQQSTLLWAVCAATLLGLSEAPLRRFQSSSDTEKGGLDADATYASLSLHHAYVAAGPLLMQVAPQQSPFYVDATVRALLLCRALVCCKDSSDIAYASCLSASAVTSPTGAARADVSLASTQRSEEASDEWPMILSSASAVRVCSLPAFLALQCALCTAMYSARQCPQASEAPLESPLPPCIVVLLEGLAAARAAPLDCVREWPAWKLFAQLLREPALAQMWLHDTFLCPSSHLLTWIVGALGRDDVDGYAMLRAWLGGIQSGPRLSLVMLEVLRAEAERRHRSAVARRLRKPRH